MKPVYPLTFHLKFSVLLGLLSLSIACVLLFNMTIKGGTSQACAVCKYQRRKCSKECPLAPHFPADQPKMFQNAHRLFGVSNIMRILRQVHDEQREEAMRSIKYESDMRARFPVHGCWGIICQLNYQLEQVIEELRYVHTQLAICKDQNQYQIPTSPMDYSPSSQLQLGIATSNNVLPVYQHLAPNDFLMNRNNGVYVEANDDMVKPSRVQHPYFNSIVNNNAMAVQSQLYLSQGFPIQQEMDVSHDYDDIPFDTIADDRQSDLESKEACESRCTYVAESHVMRSGESSLKDTTQSIELVTENDLKSAAACFSLTSVK